MSRVSVIEQITADKQKSALKFHWDSLWAPPIMSLFTPDDINELIRIATSLRYSGNITKKYDMIDVVMRRRGFRRAHSGTNRICYNFLESSAFVAKVAVDSVGIKDSPAEFINQEYFKPFCCKIFEVHPSGVIAFIERVNPISSIEEFISVKDDVFNMMITKIIGKYVVDDLGAKSFMNFGVRQNSYGVNFGPVIIDFPYVYETDGAKLKCKHSVVNPYTGKLEPCMGDIDYDAGFNSLYCTKCGREYKAIDLAKAKDEDEIQFEYTDKERQFAERIRPKIRAQIVDRGEIIFDSGRKSKRYVSKEDYKMNYNVPEGSIKVSKIYKAPRETTQQIRKRLFSELQVQYYNNLQNAGVFNPVIDNTQIIKATTVKSSKDPNAYNDPYLIKHIDDYEEVENKPALVEEPGMRIRVRKNTNTNTNTTVDYTMKEYMAVEEMEKAIFPEASETVEPIHATELEVIDNNPVEEEESESKFYAAPPMPQSVISDAEFQEMLREAKRAFGDEEIQEEESTIANPEADKNPINSPIIRPYADPKNSVYYKEPKEEVKPLMQQIEDAVSDNVSPTADIGELLDRSAEMEMNDGNTGEDDNDEEDSETDDDYSDDSEYAEAEEIYNRLEQQDLKKQAVQKRYITNKRRQ